MSTEQSPAGTTEIRRGTRTLTQRLVPFTARDGMQLHLVNVRGAHDPTRAPVMLVHGAGMRTESWVEAPIETTLVDTLVDAGYDVWLENWRGSIHAGPNPWTLDQAAVHDHPAAVRTIVEETGADDVKAVIQCMGSTSFTMSALAGLVPEVSTIVANSVSLHTVVPPAARRKARYLRPLINPVAPYLDPNWGEHPTTPLARGLSALVNTTHRECRNPVCRMASFIYGAGRPTLWLHENLNGETHDWLSGEFGPAPRQFFDQIARCIEAGHLVSVDGLPGLPEDFTAQPPQTDARFVLLAGERNRCFLPIGQRRTFEFLERQAPGRHSLHLLPGYSHLDVFIGRNAYRDTYPLILQGLEAGVQAT
jgi:pimeloyl-ACP methyl ester carboxylesterase